MRIAVQTELKNALLRKLPTDAFNALAPCLRLIDFPFKKVLIEANELTTHVFFLERGIASMVALGSDSQTIEIGQVGREGMIGAHVILKADRTPNRAFMQAGGCGYRVLADEILRVVRAYPVMSTMFLNYVHCCDLQSAHSALASGRFRVYERLARWLLMSHDRLDGDYVSLTHSVLSGTLGVRRPSITDQIHIMEGNHIIRASRGKIRILNRKKLEEIAGGCYGIPEREYARLIGEPVKLDPSLLNNG